MRTIPTLDLAVRLRLAITRTSRRLRQEAGAGLTPADRRARHRRRAWAADPLRARQARARAAAHGDAAGREARGARGAAARGRSAGPPLLVAVRHARGARAARGAAPAQDRLPGPPHRGPRVRG